MDISSKKQSIFSFSQIKKQIWPNLLLGLLLSLLGAGCTILIAIITKNPLWRLTKDPAEILRFPPYVGFLSNLDVMLWIATATICLFSGLIMKRYNSNKKAVQFIIVSGIFNFILGVDDLFLFHDHVLPSLLHIHEFFFYMLYMIVFLVYIFFFARQIFRYDFLIFMIAMALFIISRDPTTYIFPFRSSTGDVLKYFGIVFWLIFFSKAALQEIHTLIQNKVPI